MLDNAAFPYGPSAIVLAAHDTDPGELPPVDGIEVVQAIQNLGGAVPLIAEKRTYVRVYLGAPSSAMSVRGRAPRRPAASRVEVRHKANGPWTKVSSLGVGSTPAQLLSRRENLSFSLDFRAAHEAATVADYPGPSAFSWDTDGSYGDWYGGHELSHTLGRFHPGFCGSSFDDPAYPFANGQLANADGAFTGLDVGDSDLGITASACRAPRGTT